jgi:hypothetical protein
VVGTSREAKEILTEEVRDAAGDEAADRAAARLGRDDVGSGGPPTLGAFLASNRLVLIGTLALAVMIGVIAALALENWWVLALPLVVHMIFSGLIATLAIRVSTQVEKPDPVAVGRLEEAGVADPEKTLNDLVEQSAGEGDGDRARRAVDKDEGETTRPDEDAGQAAVEQQGAITPASDSTEQAGS